MKWNYPDMALVFRALSDENRLMILKQLQTKELCAYELLKNIDIAQSTLSHHMCILTKSGLVKARKEGKWTYYSFDAQGIKITETFLKQMVS